MKLLRILMCTVFMIASTHASSEDNAWSAFLNTKDQTAYKILSEKLTECSDSVCLKKLSPASSDLEALLKLVNSGDIKATDIAFLSIRFLDGGDLEDAYRSLGQLTESNPQLFLTEIKERHISDHQIQRLLRMLPLETVDDTDKKRRIVKRRIKCLSKVDNPALQETRSKSMGILKKYLTQLKD